VQNWVTENELTLHPTKTKIVDARSEGFDFLGYHFRGDLRVPRTKSLTKLKDAVREKTKRKNGHCMLFICAGLNSQLRGWFVYFRHCHWTVFRNLDAWIRGRLRSIMRKRHGKRGRSRGTDQQRWPNTYFGELGLYSLHAAHARFGQSSHEVNQ
jgi:RNA-directed DNA polymerase